MALWFHTPRTSKTDKFQSVRRMGLERHTAQEYGGYTYHFVHCRPGTTVRRSLYHVSVANRHGNRVAYLTNFRTPREAADAARAWIDATTQTRREADFSRQTAEPTSEPDLR